ncbi:MAG: hypothetical protein PWQ85_354 [Geotoga sp.]|jgi:hypothetical protein|nr:hypothetical protein [Geotoga sp.]
MVGEYFFIHLYFRTFYIKNKVRLNLMYIIYNELELIKLIYIYIPHYYEKYFTKNFSKKEEAMKTASSNRLFLFRFLLF